MTEYEQCPFCDRLFEVPTVYVATDPYQGHELYKHIEKEHRKVRVRKGSNYKWMDVAEVKKRLWRKA